VEGAYLPVSVQDKMPPLRAALIVDGPTLPTWVADAVSLAVASERIRVVALFVCTNNNKRRRMVKHLAYYGMRFLFMRPKSWRSVPVSNVVDDDVERVIFSAEEEGAWQRLPKDVLDRAAEFDLDVALKFGMGLLRDPQLFPARNGVLSYHHGDPFRYRGRPAGFYELRDDASYVGAVVQRLSNRLDGGEYLAQGHFRIERHSYRNTLESLYTGSVVLLEKALLECVKELPKERPPLGSNYRLPSNGVVVSFLMRLLYRKMQRLSYGVFWRKAWRLFEIDSAELTKLTYNQVLQGNPLPLPSNADFLADPFYLDGMGQWILCERMPESSVHGDIVRIGPERGSAEVLLAEPGRHISYPYVFASAERLFMIPEVAGWSSPFLLEMDPCSANPLRKIMLKGLETERLLDPTLVEYEGTFWLFASPETPYRKMDSLMLWYSDTIEGPYEGHPMNPIVQSPGTARSAGKFMKRDGRLIRFGQDNSAGYGARLAVMEIQVLTKERYRERQIGRFQLKDWCGPHTIDFSSKNVLVDGYQNVFDPFAWVQRLRERF